MKHLFLLGYFCQIQGNPFSYYVALQKLHFRYFQIRAQDIIPRRRRCGKSGTCPNRSKVQGPKSGACWTHCVHKRGHFCCKIGPYFQIFTVMAFDKRSLQYCRRNVNIIAFLLSRFWQVGKYWVLGFFFRKFFFHLKWKREKNEIFTLHGRKTFKNVIKIQYEEWFAQCVQSIALYAINHHKVRSQKKLRDYLRIFPPHPPLLGTP